MSEYQWVEFRAIDAPLNEDALKFMGQQSTRAEIDRYRFRNEYHFGDFRGDEYKMLRRGYDFHVHYANFGVRRIVMKFHDGFAFAEQLERFTIEHQIIWIPDDNGTGGILDITPEGDAGSWEDLWELNSLLSDLLPIREMIMCGDMRSLFLLNLAFNYDDDDELEVPPGLSETLPVLERLAEFYEIDSFLNAEAAKLSVSNAESLDDEQIIEEWLSRTSHDQLKDELRKNLLAPQTYPVQLIRQLRRAASPDFSNGGAKIILGELRTQADQAHKLVQQKRRAALDAQEAERKEKAAHAHQQLLESIAANPKKSLQHIDKAVAVGNRDAYRVIAKTLKLLAEACGVEIAEQKANELRSEFKNRSALKSELKSAGF